MWEVTYQQDLVQIEMRIFLIHHGGHTGKKITEKEKTYLSF